jgi:hypothetical protein
MSATRILAAYREGERKPVEGPLTYAEALELAQTRDRLLDALKEVLEMLPRPVPRDQRSAFLNACATAAEAEFGQ